MTTSPLWSCSSTNPTPKWWEICSGAGISRDWHHIHANINHFPNSKKESIHWPCISWRRVVQHTLISPWGFQNEPWNPLRSAILQLSCVDSFSHIQRQPTYTQAVYTYYNLNRFLSPPSSLSFSSLSLSLSFACSFSLLTLLTYDF